MMATGKRPAPRPNGWLLRRIPVVVAEMPGRGCSRAELAAVLHVRETDKTFDLSVLVCRQRGAVDFCWGYVVAPARTDEEGKQ